MRQKKKKKKHERNFCCIVDLFVLSCITKFLFPMFPLIIIIIIKKKKKKKKQRKRKTRKNQTQRLAGSLSLLAGSLIFTPSKYWNRVNIHASLSR